MLKTSFLLLALSVAVSAQEPATEVTTMVPPAMYDITMKPAEIITHPGPEYDAENRYYAMVIGMDRTPRGRLWAAWVAGGDSPLAHFVLATSDDNGTSWSKPRLVIHPPKTATGIHESILVGNLWTDPNGKLWLFFDQSLQMFDGRAGVWAITCDNPDDAEPKWSEPRRLWHGMTLNKPTVLKNGEWLLPISLWTRSTMQREFADAFHELDDQRMAHLFVSADQGKTWTRRGGVLFPKSQFDEHMVVELKDGRLWMMARTSYGLADSYSADGGRTWSEPQPSKIQNVSARFFLRRLASGNLILVKNGPINKKLAGRSHMTAFLSEDEGQTWKGGLVIDERNLVSYPDGFQAPDGTINIIHDRDRASEREILMARFTEADVLAGKYVTAGSQGKMLVSKALGVHPGAVLHNGITFSQSVGDPKSDEVMPVPYLKEVPKIIPINVGRQLFVDDFLVESSTLKRTFHSAEKFADNPVYKAETRDELKSTGLDGDQQAVTYLGHGGVFYDPQAKHFNMYHTAGWRGGLALATSPDLVHWTRPDLGLAGGNLILPPGKQFAGGDNSVWLDLSAKPKEERVKLLVDRLDGSHTLHTSADGRIWSNGTLTGKAGDYCSFYFDPFRKVWVYSIKQGGPRGRSRYYSESSDFLKGADWKNSTYWVNADKLDQPDPKIGEAPQLYSLNAVAYESLMLGEFYILLGPDNRICDEGKFPKITEIKLGFSRDGFHWDRPDRRPFIAPTQKEGSWERGYIHGTTGVVSVIGDKLYFPYTAYSGVAPDGSKGMYTGASVGLATLRRDGFASMDAGDGDEGGTLTTRVVAFHGRFPFVNVDVNAKGGELRVEVLDEKGGVFPQFSKEKCVAISGDSTIQEVRWEGTANLDAIRGKPVKFRFHLTRGKLYSFWVSRDETGASQGYLGAGGPGHGGVVDTEGRGGY